MSVEQARTFRSQAEGKQKGGMMSMFSGGPKYDEAADLYQKAANQFKLAKDWQSAADCFCSFAFCSAKAGMPSEESAGYVDAARCLKNISASESVEWFEKAASIYAAAGRFNQAAKIIKEMAEIFETSSNEKKALDYYQKAQDMFALDDHSKSQVTACALKRAEMLGEMDMFEESAQIFEQEGDKAMLSPMLQFGARELYLKAGILYLAMGDAVSAKIACDRFHQKDPRFDGTRESTLLKGVTAAFADSDLDAFREKLAEYDQVSRLDNWKSKLLLKAVQKLESPDLGAQEVDLT